MRRRTLEPGKDSRRGATMSWDRKRGGKLYYYRSQRINGRCVKRYIGTGPEAEEQAHRDEASRRRRRVEQEAWRTERTRLAAADATLLDIRLMASVLFHATLMLAGYHVHHRQIRRRRNAKTHR